MSEADGSICLLCFASLEQLRPRHLKLLSAVERDRRERYARAEDRDRFALGAVLLRLLAGASAGTPAEAVVVERTCPRCGEPHGRPRLPGSGLHASVTHAGRIAGAAICAGGPVGIDLEAERAGEQGPLAGLDRASEQGPLAGLDRAGEQGPLAESIRAPGERPARTAGDLHVTWTRKEAVLKATGVGLELSMSRVRVSAPDCAPALLAYDGGAAPAARMLDLRPAPGYVGCACVLSGAPVRFERVAAEELLG